MLRPRIHKRRLGYLLLAGVATLSVVVVSAAAPPSRASGARLPGTALTPIGIAPRLPVGLARLGGLPARRMLTVAVALRPRDPAALRNYVNEVTRSGSPVFHRYLTPKVFASEFGPSATVIRAIERLLRASDLEVGEVSENHLLIPVRGRVSDLDRAFHTRLIAYRERGGGIGWEATGAPRLPRDLASSVDSVVGLDNVLAPRAVSFFPERKRRATPSDLAGPVRSVTGAPSACAAALSLAESENGWTEDEIAKAYGLDRLYAEGGLGAGQTIDLLELEPYERSDLATFDRCFFGESHTGQVSAIHVDGFNDVGPGSGEALLDVEVLSALAPDANIDVYEAPNTSYGPIDAYDEMVSSDSANVISTSWGECETAIQLSAPGTQQVENDLFEEAAAQGQTVFAAAGDTGSDDCAGTQFQSNKPEPPYLSVDDPASQPDVVGVGGTSLLSDRQPLGSSAERAWNDGPTGGGGGGGVSDSWASPEWQVDSGVPGISSPAGRLVPDVSAAADENHGLTIYMSNSGSPTGGQASSNNENWQTIGGTSGAAPIWAAVIADIASSAAVCPGLPRRLGGADLGFVEPELYAVASADYSAAFHNVTLGNNDVYRLGLGYSAAPGFNLATGLGSPIVTSSSGQPGLARLLCLEATSGISSLPNPVVSGLGPTDDGPTTGGNTATISGSGFQPTTAAKVSVSFGSASATVQSVSPTSVTVIVPASPLAPASAANDAAGTVNVVVTVTDSAGSSSSVSSNATRYEYVDEQSPGAQTPSVSGIGPSGGNVTGGSRVDIYGSGFSAATVEEVTFGGVPAEDVTVIGAGEIRAVVPPESSATECATGDGFEPATVCQVEVAVRTTAGVSTPDQIRPPENGPVVFGPQGIVEVSSGFESAPASTEYDYASFPEITSITPNPAQPSGSRPVVIEGSGFSLITFDWVNFGPATSVASQQLRILSLSPTEITIRPPHAPSNAVNPSPLPGGVSIQSLSGVSNVAHFSYAGTPELERLSLEGGSARGGSRLRLVGRGLGDVTSVSFISELGSSSTVTVRSASIRDESAASLEVITPAHATGPVAVVPCSIAGCAKTRRVIDTFVFYAPSGRVLSAFVPRSGGADGGTVVTLFGDDVASARAVVFGSRSTSRFESNPRYPASDPDVVSVISPPGPAGRAVAVSVVLPGTGRRSLAQRRFRYRPSVPSAPVDVAVSEVAPQPVLSWQPPESDGGSRLTEYVVVASTAGAPPEMFSLSARSSSLLLSALLPGHTYRFSVAAVNAAFGRGRPGEVSVTVPS